MNGDQGHVCCQCHRCQGEAVRLDVILDLTARVESLTTRAEKAEKMLATLCRCVQCGALQQPPDDGPPWIRIGEHDGCRIERRGNIVRKYRARLMCDCLPTVASQPIEYAFRERGILADWPGQYDFLKGMNRDGKGNI